MKNKLQIIIKNYCDQNPQINLNSPASQEALAEYIKNELQRMGVGFINNKWSEQ